MLKLFYLYKLPMEIFVQAIYRNRPPAKHILKYLKGCFLEKNNKVVNINYVHHNQTMIQ